VSLVRRLTWELRETARRPERLRRLGERGTVRDFLSSLSSEGSRVDAGPWHEDETARFTGRKYDTYHDYVTHQSSKLGALDLSQYDLRYRALLADRLRANGWVKPAARVLCLAARIGTEVKAFHDLGCFAVGIDLNPGEKNRYVLHGDFHDVQFVDASVDVVFTNSLDHSLEVARLLDEVSRVLDAQGVFVAEVSNGLDEGYAPREFESFYWRTIEDLVGRIEARGFERVSSLPFDEPWPGQHLTFRTVGS
jgi:SAM-dependent methyltransferase